MLSVISESCLNKRVFHVQVRVRKNAIGFIIVNGKSLSLPREVKWTTFKILDNFDDENW